MEIDQSFRDRITTAISSALEPLPTVLAAWEGGSAAFGAVDGYSDIDLNILVDDDVAFDRLYAVAEASLCSVSPITPSHFAPPGRYYKLKDGGEFVGFLLRKGGQSGKEFYRDVTGGEQSFVKGDILSRRELHSSLMPEGLVGTLTDAELRDLLEFLMPAHGAQ